MKIHALYLAFAAMLAGEDAWATHREEKILFGEDDRVLARDLPQRSDHYRRFLEAGKSVAGLVPLELLEKRPQGGWRLTPNPSRLCPGERYAGVPTAATCSGFLVGPKTLATAGHCVQDMGLKVVFDFREDGQSFSQDQVFSPIRVLKFDPERDLALVELDRPVGRPSLVPRHEDPRPGDSLFMVGHPLGLPLTVTFNGKLAKVDGAFLMSDLDSFTGNSGSPVFHWPSFQVMGLHVTGAPGTVFRHDLACQEYLWCDESAGPCRPSLAARLFP